MVMEKNKLWCSFRYYNTNNGIITNYNVYFHQTATLNAQYTLGYESFVNGKKIALRGFDIPNKDYSKSNLIETARKFGDELCFFWYFGVKVDVNVQTLCVLLSK